jgi:hypothetical protein
VLLVYPPMMSWSSRIRVRPQRLVCHMYSACAAAPALGHHGAAHPDAVVARSACMGSSVLESSHPRSLVHAHSDPSFFPVPALVYCVHGHVLVATPWSTSSCYASPRVLHIGLGGAGNHRGLARCAGFWSSLQLADLFLYFVQFYITFGHLSFDTLFPSLSSTSSTTRPIHTPFWTR